MDEIDEILQENGRRHDALAAPFNPLSGEGAPGKRFCLDVADIPTFPRMWLPESMRSLPIVDMLQRHHRIDSVAQRLKVAPDIIAELFIRARLRHDFPFWAATCVHIKRKGGGDDVRFILNRPQRKFVERLESARTAGQPVRLILLKARQWGGSTCSQLYMAWLQLMHSRGLNSLIVAHQVVGSDEIKDMFDRMISAYPAILLHAPGEKFDENEKKMVGVGKSGAIFRVPLRNCKIKIGTAENPDSCRGGDYNLVHLSEVGIWKATDGKCPEDIVRSACSGILLRPMTMIVMESTANGTGNFFHREYLSAARGESQFAPLFVGWYEIDQYSLNFADDEERREFAHRLWEGKDSDEVSERRQSGKYMWWLWSKGATLEALHWYELERAKYSDHAGMASEYPSDDVEAFAHSGLRVFDPYAVEQMRMNCIPPSARGEIDEKGYFASDSTGLLLIWKHPERRERRERRERGMSEERRERGERGERIRNRYLTVVDIGGRSDKSDWTVIAVFDRIGMLTGGVPEIVAQWRGHADMDIVASKAADIAGYYDDSLLVIESNTIETREYGRQNEPDSMPFLMSALRGRYPNLYVRQRSADDIREGKSAKYGFHTNAATKPMVVAELVKAVREGGYMERDERAIAELLQYEQRSNGSYGAITGCHDDILMTRAIGIYISTREMPPPRRIQTRRPSGSRLANEASF